MLRKIIIIPFMVLLLFLIVPTSTVHAITIDNDGSERETPYGDSKIPKAYTAPDYYDCYVPYALTPEDIGGYATGVLAYTYSTYNYSMVSHYPDRINNKFSHLVNGYQPMGGSFHGASVSVESDTGLQVATDAKGNQYYMMAIQKFFYNFGGLDQGGFPDWGGQNGQLVDVILTDGTVVHFTIVDANAEAHTNGGPKEERLWNVQYTFADLKKPQYLNLFHAAYGNMIEISGRSWGSGVSEFMQKYNMSTEGNQVAYYRMYNAKIDDSPDRDASVGKEVSYSLGDVTIGSSSSNSTEDNSESSQIVNEWELIGMPSRSALGEKQKDITLPTRGNLGIGEAYSVQRVKEDIETSKVALAYTNVRVAVVFIGLFMVFYSVLLLLSFMFDKANQFIEISLIKIISFGFLEYSDDDTAKGETGYASTGRILVIIVVICIIGLLLISGGVLPFMMELTRGIYQKFS